MTKLSFDSKIAVIGAGLSGAVVANSLATFGFGNVTVLDQRSHIAGNIYDELEPSTNIMVHKYGPHIFHTDDQPTWDYIRRFGEFAPYVQRSKAHAGGRVYSFPINLQTINQVYGADWSPEEAKVHMDRMTLHYRHPVTADERSFEGYALANLGPTLYSTFLKGYTSKQWGRDPSSLPASIAKRLPIRFSYDDNAYDHRFQGIPRAGYAHVVGNMLDSKRIKVKLNTKMGKADAHHYDFVFVSGPIDEWFDYKFGELPYRTLDFETQIMPDVPDWQGCAVMNHCDVTVPYTRTTEHKHFQPWRVSPGTVVTKEFPREWKRGDVHFYPVNLDERTLLEYQSWANNEMSTAFVGRLGTYRYLDMDKAIMTTMSRVKQFLREGV